MHLTDFYLSVPEAASGENIVQTANCISGTFVQDKKNHGKRKRAAASWSVMGKSICRLIHFVHSFITRIFGLTTDMYVSLIIHSFIHSFMHTSDTLMHTSDSIWQLCAIPFGRLRESAITILRLSRCQSLDSCTLQEGRDGSCSRSRPCIAAWTMN